jgi:hypothetical protein
MPPVNPPIVTADPPDLEHRVRILRVDLQKLVEALGLPDETALVNARLSFTQVSCVELVIQHPDFKPLPMGAQIPFVLAVFNEEGFKQWM